MLNLQSGVYALSGAALSTLAGRGLNLEAGTYLITGAALAVLAQRGIVLEPGTYTFLGEALGLDWSGAQIVLAVRFTAERLFGANLDVQLVSTSLMHGEGLTVAILADGTMKQPVLSTELISGGRLVGEETI
jgi:hypothetical protein